MSRIFVLEEELKKSNKKIRDIAMEWILSMDPLEFQERVLHSVTNVTNDKFKIKLPDFVRAVEGDIDFPDPMIPVRETNAIFAKKIYSPGDLERSRYNFADENRKILRYMSEEDFIKLCYHDLFNDD